MRTDAGALLRAPPIPPSGFVQSRRGLFALASPSHTPPLCSPHGGAPRRRPRGQPLGLSRRSLGEGGRLPPRDSSLPGAARKMSVVTSYLYKFLAACAQPPFGLRAAELAALMLALPPSLKLWRDKPVAQRPRTPRAFLRRFKPTAQSRSHAGCALGGDRLASSSSKCGG